MWVCLVGFDYVIVSKIYLLKIEHSILVTLMVHALKVQGLNFAIHEYIFVAR